jgi:hypothetical protein
VETVVRLVTSIQGVLQVLALGAALFALYELVMERDWRRRIGHTIARVWVVFLCGLVGVSGLFLGQNAVLTIADQFAVPLAAAQVAFVVSLVAAVAAWTHD